MTTASSLKTPHSPLGCELETHQSPPKTTHMDVTTSDPLSGLSPFELRALCRTGTFSRPTAGLASGYVQANLVILPASLADDFRLFCQRNPKPCPLLEETLPGDPFTKALADHADLRTDLPLYRVFEHGHLADEVADIQGHWRDDFVAFLIGCSFTFESALLRAGLGVRHLEELRPDGQPKNVPMYRTNIACEPAGVFHGPLVVSMRPYAPKLSKEAARITARFPGMHGAPVHSGDPAAVGVLNLDHPDWGDPVTIRAGEIPVFWACGVTPQAVVLASKPPIAITHSPGHMFVSDRRDQEYEVD